jgi:hypothetical protein
MSTWASFVAFFSMIAEVVIFPQTHDDRRFFFRRHFLQCFFDAMTLKSDTSMEPDNEF